jgi:hypothetical protein
MNKSIKNLFGFYYCEIQTCNDSYLGLLPIRNNNGINFPLGKWYGWYFSEELKFAQQNGYKIKNILITNKRSIWIINIFIAYWPSTQETNFSMETDSITMGIELCKIPHSSEHWP